MDLHWTWRRFDALSLDDLYDALALRSRVFSVEQACANTSNFIARDLCRIDACRAAGNARDPICVWYRRLEEGRRNRLAN